MIAASLAVSLAGCGGSGPLLLGPPDASTAPPIETTGTVEIAMLESESGWGTCATLRSVWVLRSDAVEGSPWIATTPDGDTILRGYTTGPITFGPGEVTETTLSPQGPTAWFLSRTRPSGEHVWSLAVDGSEQTSLVHPLAMPDGAVVAGGTYDGTTVIGHGRPSEITFPHAGESDIWLSGLDAAGNVTWTRSFGSAADEVLTHLVALPDGAFLAVGWTSGTLTIGAGDPGEITLDAIDDKTPMWFVARHEGDGTVTWVRVFYGVAWSTWWGAELAPVVTDESGSFLFAGSLDNDTTAAFGDGADEVKIDPAGREAFVAQYDGAGALQWLETASGSGVGGYVAAVAPDEAVFAAGWFVGIATFGRDQDQETAISDDGSPNESSWIARYGPGGELAWVLPALGVHTRDGASRGTTLLLGGTFYESALFDGGGPDATWFTTAEDAADGFVARYDDDDFRCALRLRSQSLSDDAPPSVSVEQVVSREDGGWDLVGTIIGEGVLGEGTSTEVVLTSPMRDLFVATIDLVEP